MATRLVGDGFLYNRLSPRSCTRLSLQHAHLSSLGFARLVATSAAELQSSVTVRKVADLLLLDPITFAPLRVTVSSRHLGLAKTSQSLLDLGGLTQQLATLVARV